MDANLHNVHAEVDAAVVRDNTDELLHLIIGIGLHENDVEWAVCVCLSLACHAQEAVRGNAILALGHLARRFGALNEGVVKPVVRKALQDESLFVRGQAACAVQDMEHFLKWRF